VQEIATNEINQICKQTQSMGAGGQQKPQMMDQSRIRAEKENVEYVETLGVHWRNLSVHFKDVQALAPCSGDVEAGQAVALMGPTGCGKTSLLNALARRAVWKLTSASGAPDNSSLSHLSAMMRPR